MTYPWNMDRCFNLSDPGRQFGDHQSRALADQSHAAADASEAPFWCGHWVIDPRYISNSCWFHKPGEWWYAMSPHQYPIKKTWVFDGSWWLITVFLGETTGCLFVGHSYFCWKPIHFLIHIMIHITLLYIPLQFHHNPIIHLAHHRGTATCVLVSDAVVLRQVS